MCTAALWNLHVYFLEELFCVIGCQFGLLNVSVQKKGGVPVAVIKNTKFYSSKYNEYNCINLPFVVELRFFAFMLTLLINKSPF
jgi:hypothetical protein